MRKIQHGFAGFFIGAFIGLLLGLIESRMINAEKHSALLFIIIALTIITCGIIGITQGHRIERNTRIKK
ncbi:MAG: hypothetical protein ABI402_16685 [Ferruginibacter sp.]